MVDGHGSSGLRRKLRVRDPPVIPPPCAGAQDGVECIPQEATQYILQHDSVPCNTPFTKEQRAALMTRLLPNRGQQPTIRFLFKTPVPGDALEGGVVTPPPPLQGAQPMPSQCIPDGTCLAH